jgi:hypothetical protein
VRGRIVWMDLQHCYGPARVMEVVRPLTRIGTTSDLYASSDLAAPRQVV